MATDEYGEEKKKFITMKSITWFIIASIAMIGYYSLINYGLMKVQGLDYMYLFNSGEPAAASH
jgi:hypothetical protein